MGNEIDSYLIVELISENRNLRWLHYQSSMVKPRLLHDEVFCLLYCWMRSFVNRVCINDTIIRYVYDLFLQLCQSFYFVCSNRNFPHEKIRVSLCKLWNIETSLFSSATENIFSGSNIWFLINNWRTSHNQNIIAGFHIINPSVEIIIFKSISFEFIFWSVQWKAGLYQVKLKMIFRNHDKNEENKTENFTDI